MANGSSSAPAGAGIGFFPLLGLTFIVLKLCGVIGWSWLWVLAPFWIPLSIVLAILGFVGFCFFMSWLTRPKAKVRR